MLLMTVALIAPGVAQLSLSQMSGRPGIGDAGKSSADQIMVTGLAEMNQEMDAAPMTGNPDQDFCTMMIRHHRGSISLAEVELRYGHDPFLRKLATKIIAAQKKEIAEMRTWQQRPQP